MTDTKRPADVVGILFDIGLGALFVLGLAFTVFMISDSWGAGYAIFDGVVASIICILALLRHLDRLRTAVAGLGLAAIAVGVSHVADLPQEPGPITGLALAVLVGSAIRTLPMPLAAAIGGSGLLVIGGSLLSSQDNQHGFSAVTVLNMLCWLAAMVAGLVLRGADASSGSGTSPATSSRPQSRWAR